MRDPVVFSVGRPHGSVTHRLLRVIGSATLVAAAAAFVSVGVDDAHDPAAASTGPHRARTIVRLTIPAKVSTVVGPRARAVIVRERPFVGGTLLIRGRGRVLARERVRPGVRRMSVHLRLPRLSAGTHQMRAVFRARGRRVTVSTPRDVVAVRGCTWRPSACGYPDATNTGVQHGIKLRTKGDVTVTRDGAVLQNALVNGTIEVEANNVTIRNVRIVTNGDWWAIGLRHTSNTTIDHVQIAPDPTKDRLEVGIKDVYGDATGTSITHTNIAGTGTGIQTHEGLVQDNYIHGMRLDSGDHVNGFTSNGSTVPLRINHNTILDQINQTDAIGLFEDFGVEANRTVTNNLIAGGSYTLYAGGGDKGPTHNIVVSGNRFSRIFYPTGGVFGPAADYERSGTANSWTNNVWDGRGAAISAP